MFRPQDIEKEKGVILEEIKMEEDSPDYLVHEIFSANFWKDHALGKPILGTRDTVKRFDRWLFAELLRKSIRPPNLIVDGRRQPDSRTLVDLVREAFRIAEPPARLSLDPRPRPMLASHA